MLNPSYEAILSELLTEEVGFLVIGGYAMAALGLPRFTNDLDIWVHSESQNIKRLYRALGNAGVPMDGISEDDLLSAYTFLEIGQAPVKVDIIVNLGDFSFDRAWSNRFYVQSAEIEIPFIGIREFVAIKRYAGRTVDLQDIDRLIEMGLFTPEDGE